MQSLLMNWHHRVWQPEGKTKSEWNHGSLHKAASAGNFLSNLNVAKIQYQKKREGHFENLENKTQYKKKIVKGNKNLWQEE